MYVGFHFTECLWKSPISTYGFLNSVTKLVTFFFQLTLHALEEQTFRRERYHDDKLMQVKLKLKKRKEDIFRNGS